jgi:hypothetical protein
MLKGRNIISNYFKTVDIKYGIISCKYETDITAVLYYILRLTINLNDCNKHHAVGIPMSSNH